MDLTSVIREIHMSTKKSECNRRQAIEDINKTYDKRKAELDNAMKVNLEMNTVCLDCEGSKMMDVGSYDRMWDTCKRCSGTGLEPKEESQ